MTRSTCVASLVQLFECIDNNGCSLSDQDCIMSNCSEELNNTFEYLQLECVLTLFSHPELLPFDETWNNDAKADYILNHCGTGDADGDGISPVGGDCDDSNPGIHPGALDICDDLIDQNCNGSDASCDDPDEDGYTTAAGDCDNNDASVHPGAEEICDNKDNDCDGTIDEDTHTSTWYIDSDGDGYGSASETTESCMPPEGYVVNSDDCDDSDPGIFPGAPEICGDALDNNCNALIDDDCGDSDSDGIIDQLDNCPMVPNPEQADTDGDGIGNVCDEDADGDGVDDYIDNCPEVPNPDQMDTDGDGTGDACDNDLDGDGYSVDEGDCDDYNVSINPGATEICGDALDNDCDGLIDEGCDG